MQEPAARVIDLVRRLEQLLVSLSDGEWEHSVDPNTIVTAEAPVTDKPKRKPRTKKAA